MKLAMTVLNIIILGWFTKLGARPKVNITIFKTFSSCIILYINIIIDIMQDEQSTSPMGLNGLMVRQLLLAALHLVSMPACGLMMVGRYTPIAN